MEGKLVAVIVGLAIALAGLGLATFGQVLIVNLNKLYGAMPGRFQYPIWWHKVVGAVIGVIGLLIAVVGLITVKGQS
jgi:hypothetical protein